MFKKIFITFINFFKFVWGLLKSIGTWRGILSFIIVWFVLSGTPLILLGFIFDKEYLIITGTSMSAFWLAPFTPLIPISLMFSMLIQKFVLRDKNVSMKQIKEEYNKAFKKNKESNKND